ncbi:MAG: helix-turn-helix transcriptional regulator [Bifidobacteriaceae bacterium]|nr:helix-turn-helix transcriptional regulator [Bifidobacteriaceae bacterium]
MVWGIASTFTDVFYPLAGRGVRYYWISNMVATTLALLILAFSGPLFATHRRRGNVMIAAVALIVASTVAISFVYQGGSFGLHLAQCVAGSLSGVGMALGQIAWGCFYASLDAGEIEKYIIFSVLLVMACLVLSQTGSWPLRVALLVVYPLLSLFCFILCNSADNPANSPSGPKTPRLPALSLAAAANAAKASRGYRWPWQSGIGIIGLSFTISFLWGFLEMDVIELDVKLYTATVFSGGAVALILVLYCITFARGLNLDSLYRWIAPFVALSLFLFSFRNASLVFCGSLSNFAAQMALDLLVFIYLCEAASREKGSGVAVLATGRFFLEGGILLGSAGAVFAHRTVRGGALSLGSALLFLAMIVVISTTCFLVRQSQFDRRSYSDPGQVYSRRSPDELMRTIFKDKCDAVAEEYGLTNREREVLGFLAKGRSLPSIRSELFISKSTTSSHVSHIYAKLGAHSKEDVIAIVEGASARRPDELNPEARGDE